ncbi:MAG TPA: hypothetical protein VNN10_05305 [Dehalococcoidia bacterium]|nr:hypothetical protein [Dehalococcoidia bacterium]
MPPPAVPRTAHDFILYYYAKLIIAPAAGEKDNYRFIMDRYRRLKDGELRMSDYDREIERQSQQSGACAFCRRRGPTAPMEIIPRRLGGPVGVHNLVYACAGCHESRGDRELFEWWCDVLGRDKDELPRIPAGLFLKMSYEKHAVEFRLQRRCRSIRDLWP